MLRTVRHQNVNEETKFEEENMRNKLKLDDDQRGKYVFKIYTYTYL